MWEVKHVIFVQQNFIIKEGQMCQNFGLDNIDDINCVEDSVSKFCALKQKRLRSRK